MTILKWLVLFPECLIILSHFPVEEKEGEEEI